MRRARVDAQRPRVTAAGVAPDVAPGLAAVVRAVCPGGALLLRQPVRAHSPEPGRGVEDVRTRRVANHPVDVGVLTRQGRAPGGAVVGGLQDAADNGATWR